ncbi:uncharacterized protein TNCV_51701 [Trichonephila clavipes]|nr:uncharacterized protein TNCV_51701 [Trichonephila clavipes]
MSSSPVPLKTRRVGQRCTLNLSRAETSSHWCGVVIRRGVPAQVSATSLDHGSKLRGPATADRSTVKKERCMLYLFRLKVLPLACCVSSGDNPRCRSCHLKLRSGSCHNSPLGLSAHGHGLVTGV